MRNDHAARAKKWQCVSSLDVVFSSLEVIISSLMIQQGKAKSVFSFSLLYRHAKNAQAAGARITALATAACVVFVCRPPTKGPAP